MIIRFRARSSPRENGIFHDGCKLTGLGISLSSLPVAQISPNFPTTGVPRRTLENQINEMLSLDREMRLPFVDVAIGYSSFDKY